MAAVAATGGQLLIKNIIPKPHGLHFRQAGGNGRRVEEEDDTLLVRRTEPLVRANVKTHALSGFPTDMQPRDTFHRSGPGQQHQHGDRKHVEQPVSAMWTS